MMKKPKPPCVPDCQICDYADVMERCPIHPSKFECDLWMGPLKDAYLNDKKLIEWAMQEVSNNETN